MCIRDRSIGTGLANNDCLPHHARDEPGLAPRRIYLFFQKAVRVFADIAGTRIGPGPAFVVFVAVRLAVFVALAALQREILVVPARAVDVGFLGSVAWSIR